MNRHLFILPPGVYRGANIEEIKATVAGLVEMDLFRLPYERDVYIQLAANDCISYQNKYPNFRNDVFVVIGPLGREQIPDAKVINTSTGFSESMVYSESLGVQAKEDAAAVIELAEALLIVLLATRNVIKHTKENKLAKLGIGKRKFRGQFAYTTTISLPADLEDDPDHPALGGTRCPHLRRGHIRRQHFGPGGQFIKKVWIDPIFVNADPDFVNRRVAYNVAV